MTLSLQGFVNEIESAVITPHESIPLLIVSGLVDEYMLSSSMTFAGAIAVH